MTSFAAEAPQFEALELASRSAMGTTKGATPIFTASYLRVEESV